MIIMALFNRIHEVALLLLKLYKLSSKEKRDREKKSTNTLKVDKKIKRLIYI